MLKKRLTHQIIKLIGHCYRSSVKWGHLAHLEPNSINTIFLNQNPIGSSSPL